MTEVVSPDSRYRDYHEKPDEYLQFGVHWKQLTVKPPELHTSHLLPDFEFSCEAVFAAAAK